MNRVIIHVSEVDINPQAGMGRVEYHWKEAFQDNGFVFIHIGPKEVGRLWHKALFPMKAYNYYKKLGIVPDAFIVHEPASGYFVDNEIPCFVESHGIERRYWEPSKNNLISNEKVSLKSKILYPLWRLSGCDKGLNRAKKLLLINNDDKQFAINYYHRLPEDILVFRNGITPLRLKNVTGNIGKFTVLFNGSWIDRKGKAILIKSAEILYMKKIAVYYLLIGTGAGTNEVLMDWPKYLRPFVTVVPRFHENDELKYLEESSLFVLPSFYEGQPLSLLQAMAAGKCCITTDCCGQKDLIIDNDTGLLFMPGDYVKLSLLIEQCYHNKSLTDTIGNNAMNYIREFTWESVSSEVVQYVLANL
ncbi:glycosyltransferase [Hymenobacter sp. UV11]|uniref:glycosyltransferase family 4 protein n=1 Tax=Hymenobacter sp. UV11 TaxID=1849735 RepID=UPI00105E4CE2|nr:glycosyltransferase family 4 protein [Hymenobacter sp. UV11]TDN39578.1 hypothetical protein A8B98_17985 [Hymenobacter sp. UV11]TFZ63321.1 glycosyltransferase [Hymenobacter sp. UV11]